MEVIKDHFFERRLQRFGIPDVDTSNVHPIANKDWGLVKKFINNESRHLAIIGDHSYTYTVKITKLRLAYNLNLQIKFTTLARLALSNILDFNDIDLLVVTEVYPSVVENNWHKSIVNGLLTDFLTTDGGVILQSETSINIQNTFSHIWDFVDGIFQVVKF
jgi:hypothetical protein